ncbi:MAG: hypothetical protein QGG40_03010 [Myxococcota bacterium]|nr:hypothetical protein [Myxococcota bacterium]
MSRTVLILPVGLWLIGCGQPTPETCRDICAQASASETEATPPEGADAQAPALTTLSVQEQELLGPLLEDVRAGIRPYGEERIGICQGTGRDCETFLGSNPEPLAEGKYMLFAELRVPDIGEAGTWVARYEKKCQVTRTSPSGETTSESSHDRDYTVRYAGTKRGYRLAPVEQITSPSKGGARSCSWKLLDTSNNDALIAEGTWSTPGEPS